MKKTDMAGICNVFIAAALMLILPAAQAGVCHRGAPVALRGHVDDNGQRTPAIITVRCEAKTAEIRQGQERLSGFSAVTEHTIDIKDARSAQWYFTEYADRTWHLRYQQANKVKTGQFTLTSLEK